MLSQRLEKKWCARHISRHILSGAHDFLVSSLKCVPLLIFTNKYISMDTNNSYKSHADETHYDTFEIGLLNPSVLQHK